MCNSPNQPHHHSFSVYEPHFLADVQPMLQVFSDNVRIPCKSLPSVHIQLNTLNIKVTKFLHFFNLPVSIRGSVEARTVEHTVCRISCHGCQLTRYLCYCPQISTVAVPQSKVLHNMINAGKLSFHVFELNILLSVALLQHHDALVQ